MPFRFLLTALLATLALPAASAHAPLTRLECYRTGLLAPLHPERGQTMPPNLIIWNHYGFKDFNGAGVVFLSARHDSIGDFYDDSHLGTGQVNERFSPAGHTLDRAFGDMGPIADFVNAVVQPSEGRSGSILNYLELLPISVMKKMAYLDPEGAAIQQKLSSERNPNQVMFFMGTETARKSELIKKYGKLPEAAFPEPESAAWRKRMGRLSDSPDEGGPSDPSAAKEPDYKYVNPTGTSYLVAGQDFSHGYELPMEPGMEKPITGEKYEVGRGAQITPGSFREAFRANAYYASFRSILLDAARNPGTHHVHRPDGEVTARVYGHVLSHDRLDHFTEEKSGYGFGLYSGYTGQPKEFAISESLPDFVRGQGIEHFSRDVGYIVSAAKGGLDGLRAQELFLYAKQQATYYLTETHAASPMEVQVRDYSSGFSLQVEKQVAQSAKLFPVLAGNEPDVANTLENRVSPIQEYRDHAEKRAELEAYPYNRRTWGPGPNGEHESLPEFLHRTNSVEIHLLHSDTDAPLQAEKAIVGVYYNYLAKLAKLGVPNPARVLKERGIHFAVSGEGYAINPLIHLPGKWWQFTQDELVDVGNMFFTGGPVPLVPAFQAAATSLSVDDVQALIQAHPELGREARGAHSLEIGRSHYEHYLSEPELYAP